MPLGNRLHGWTFTYILHISDFKAFFKKCKLCVYKEQTSGTLSGNELLLLLQQIYLSKMGFRKIKI